MTHLTELAMRHGIHTDDPEAQRLGLLAVFKRGETSLLDDIVKAMNADAVPSDGISSDEELDARATAAAERIRREDVVDSVPFDPSLILAMGTRGPGRFDPSDEEWDELTTKNNSRESGLEERMSIDVKHPSNIFSSDRRVAKHRKTGEPVFYRGKPVELPSDAAMAREGALLQYMFARGDETKMPTRSRALAEEVFHGLGDTGLRLKTLLSNSGSGGQFVNLDTLSDQLFTAALLSGELLPHVTVENLPEGVGPTVRSPIMGPVTLQKSTAEGTACDLFDTSGFLSNLPVTMYPWQVHIDIGLDFLRDAPLDLMTKIKAKISDTFAAEIDDDIATGAGTAGPLGIFNTSGTTIVGQSSPSPTGWDVNDLENMMRSLPRQYRKRDGARIRWLSTDTTYFRIRGISVSTSDQRRVFGMDHGAYSVFDYKWSVNESVGNPNLALVDLSYYHLLRTAMAFKYTDAGSTLQRANLGLLSARCRLGGRLMIGESCAEFNAGVA